MESFKLGVNETIDGIGSNINVDKPAVNEKTESDIIIDTKSSEMNKPSKDPDRSFSFSFEKL